MLWAILAFLIVALTKYLTALRLRTLRERMRHDQQVIDDLRQMLGQAAQKEDVLRAQAEALVTKITALNNVVQNLERGLNITAGNGADTATER